MLYRRLYSDCFLEPNGHILYINTTTLVAKSLFPIDVENSWVFLGIWWWENLWEPPKNLGVKASWGSFRFPQQNSSTDMGYIDLHIVKIDKGMNFALIFNGYGGFFGCPLAKVLNPDLVYLTHLLCDACVAKHVTSAERVALCRMGWSLLLTTMPGT